MMHKLMPLLFVALLVVSVQPAEGLARQRSLPTPLTVIGSGTAASCQSQDASNALSNAVAAGGTITFDCGPAPMVMPVNTNATDQTVVVDGGGLVSLSGENLLQIFNVFGSGDLTVQNITLVDGAGFAGAAIAISSPLAQATVKNSYLTSNDAGTANGGAVYNVGTLAIEDSSLGSNRTAGFGGAVFNNGGSVTIKDSTLISNQAVQGGGIFHSGGSVTVEGSAVRSNIASNQGGGIHVDVGSVTVVNSTFYDNRAEGGGGAYMRGQQLSITNSTFNRNRADIGGALWNAGGQTRLKNTILAGSRTTDDTDDSLNCDGPTALTEGRNIVSDNTCVPSPSAAGDLLATDPKLDPFIRNNGGSTRNFMPLPGSPAIDYGLGCPNADQRGLPRPVGPACDVGSVEYGWFLFLPGVMR